jgi:hypothetical protein
MCVVGHYAYVRTRAGGLLVFDLSNPAAPRRVGGCAAPGSVGHPAVLGQYLYLAASDRGLQVFDVSNPASPGQVFACPPIHGASRDVVVSGGRAYVTETRYSEVAPGWLSWLVIYDLQNPASPTLLGNYTGPGLFQDVTLVGGYAYLAERGSNPFDECRLEVIDVNNPAQPRRVWQSEPQGYWGGIAVAGNYACILAEVYRLRQQIPVGTV